MPNPPQARSGPESAPNPDLNVDAIVRSLRRKEGNWVSWGQACQQLQKAGYSSQSIFEETGFEPIHQNQVIVGAQVYTTLAAAQVPDTLLAHFELKGSDILYELRTLNQAERVSAAKLVVEKQLDAEEAREVAKAIKEVAQLNNPPPEFTKESGDIVAYRCWKLARQQKDLQERSRLIARGLRFACSDSARKAIEQLLTDFTVTKEKPAPPLPVYRLESETELPRLLPCLGQLPLTRDVMDAVAPVEAVGPFQQVQTAAHTTWVAIPGWQVILQAGDPISVLSDSESLPAPLPGNGSEAVLIVVDRAQQNWDPHSYFMVASGDRLELRWFEAATEVPLLGRVILVLRPKKVLDEDYIQELWQLDE